MSGSRVFQPCRSIGYVSNHVPLQVRYIKSRKENLLVTCVGKSFHTYGVSHFGLLAVSGLHPGDIACMTSDTYHVYTACGNIIYAWRRGTELKHTYRGHRHPVHLMTPFGPHLISVDERSNVMIWDIKAESVYLELTFSSTSFSITAMLHPSTYINKILFGSNKGEMQLWNIHSAKLIHSFKSWKASICCLQQAPAIDVVAIGLATGKIILHNLKYDETIMEFQQDWGLVTTISFRTDGPPMMATGSVSGHIVFWDLEERKVSHQLLQAHDSSVTGMVCLSGEPLLVTSSPDNTLKLWIFDMTDGGARLLRIREGHSAPPTHIRFHGANGHNILSAAGDSTLRIFNTQTEQFNKSLGRASYNRKISKKRGRGVEDPLKMPPIVKFTSETTREKEWDNIAAIHQGLAMITTWSYDKVKMGELKLVPERFHKKNVDVNQDVTATCLCLTHCGNFIVVGYNTGHIDRFNIQSGIWRDCYGNPKAHGSAVRGVAVDNFNQVVMSGSSDCTVKFWRFKNKGTDHLTSLTVEEPVNFFRSHGESSLLAIALEDFALLVLDTESRTIVRKFLGHTAQLTDATFSPDSRWLVTAAMDCTIRLWDVPTGHLVDEFSTEPACISLDFSPTGAALVTAHVDCLGLYLWTNKTLFAKITLKAITPSDEPPMVDLPEHPEYQEEEDEELVKTEDEYTSPEQLDKDMATLSGLAASRWQNLLNIDVIKRRNKPTVPPKTPKAAPFFIPTVPTLNADVQFDLGATNYQESTGSKILVPASFVNLTEFGKLLRTTKETNNFCSVIEKLKTLGPSMIDFEIKCLAPEGGGSIDVMLQFLRCIENVLQSNRDFEIAESCLGAFLKTNGSIVAQEDVLRNYLPNIATCHDVTWGRLQERLMYGISVVQNMKNT